MRILLRILKINIITDIQYEFQKECNYALSKFYIDALIYKLLYQSNNKISDIKSCHDELITWKLICEILRIKM
jgi:hypothetical protein